MHFTEGISSRGCCCFPAEKDFWGGAWEEGRGPKPSLVSASAPRHRYQLAQDKDHVQVSPDRWVVAVLDKAILTKLEKGEIALKPFLATAGEVPGLVLSHRIFHFL